MALAVVTDCPPETGGTSEAEGVDSFPFSPFRFNPRFAVLNLLTLGNSNKFDCSRLLADFRL